MKIKVEYLDNLITIKMKLDRAKMIMMEHRE